jgi:hypothetical protein
MLGISETTRIVGDTQILWNIRTTVVIRIIGLTRKYDVIVWRYIFWAPENIRTTEIIQIIEVSGLFGCPDYRGYPENI